VPSSTWRLLAFKHVEICGAVMHVEMCCFHARDDGLLSRTWSCVAFKHVEMGCLQARGDCLLHLRVREGSTSPRA